MEENKNISFHKSFKPETMYIAGILELACNENTYTIEEISAITGIPTGKSSGKVEPHIFYANYMGLIDFEKQGKNIYKIKQTKLGEIVYKEDPNLQERLTLILCHAMMLRDEYGAAMWRILFKTIMPKYKNNISRDILDRELERNFDKKITTRNISVVMSSYQDMFATLDILTESAGSWVVKPIELDNEFIILYGYILLDCWEKTFPCQDEISAKQFESLDYGSIFGWNEKMEYEVIIALSDRGIIRLNRQLVPYTMLRLASKENIVNKLYSELC